MSHHIKEVGLANEKEIRDKMCYSRSKITEVLKAYITTQRYKNCRYRD